MLHPLMHSLSHVVGSCCAKFETGPTFGSTTPGQHFFHSMIAEGDSLSIRPSYGAREEAILDGGGGRGRRERKA